ncbi:hypothetical protein ACPESR_15160 [Nocardia testacea]|uniref:hypothetical protein n=1 Tax=Nocardia testacea TaxID=248551 RepID=UPI003C2BCC00
MHPRRLIAIGVILAALLTANTYAGFPLYAFTAGPRVEAEVLGCSGQKFPQCRGYWTLPDGSPQSGVIADAGRADVGKVVPVRVAPVAGAYRDRAVGLWIRLLYAIVVDSALVVAGATIAVVMVRSRRRARELRAESAPGQILWIRRGGEIRDAAGRKVWSGRRSRRSLVELTGSEGAQFRIRAEHGALRLVNSAGGAAGRVEADHGYGRTIGYTIYDVTDTPAAVVVNTSVKDSAWVVTGTAGARFGELVISIGSHVLLLHPAAPAALRPMLAALLLDIDRMLLEARPRRLDRRGFRRRRSRGVVRADQVSSSSDCQGDR